MMTRIIGMNLFLIRKKNMSEIGEVELHLFYKNKDLLESWIIKEIENRLKTDESLRNEFDEIIEFYENYARLQCELTDNTFQLKPLILNLCDKEKILLAAQHSESTESQIKYIRTFLSSEKYLIVRMFNNTAIGEYEFHVISDGDENMKNAVIKIPFLNKELVTDKFGFANIKASYIPNDIEISVTLNKNL
jgi:hypothetical protein